jgi:hypothetical protein
MHRRRFCFLRNCLAIGLAVVAGAVRAQGKPVVLPPRLSTALDAIASSGRRRAARARDLCVLGALAATSRRAADIFISADLDWMDWAQRAISSRPIPGRPCSGTPWRWWARPIEASRSRSRPARTSARLGDSRLRWAR